MRNIVIVVVIALILLAGWSALFTVYETQYAVVTRFGDPVREIREAGLRFKWPAPIERVVYFDKRLLVFDVPSFKEPPKEYLTQDKKNVEVSSYTCWRITDPTRFLETVGTRGDAEAILRDVVVSELGNVLGQTPLSGLLSLNPGEVRLEEMMDQIRLACTRQAASEWGMEIVDFRIKRVNFPEQNRDSVFERMRAERKRIATRYRSEGQQEATTIRAEADKKKTEILADAYRQAQEIEGRAEAEATRIYAQAYGRDPDFYEFVRTLESYEKALKFGTTILLPADSPYLKMLSTQLPELEPVPVSEPPAGSHAGSPAPASQPAVESHDSE